LINTPTAARRSSKEKQREKGTGTEKMNVFSFEFQLVAGKESSISLSAIRTEPFKSKHVPAEV